MSSDPTTAGDPVFILKGREATNAQQLTFNTFSQSLKDRPSVFFSRRSQLTLSR